MAAVAHAPLTPTSPPLNFSRPSPALRSPDAPPSLGPPLPVSPNPPSASASRSTAPARSPSTVTSSEDVSASIFDLYHSEHGHALAAHSSEDGSGGHRLVGRAGGPNPTQQQQSTRFAPLPEEETPVEHLGESSASETSAGGGGGSGGGSLLNDAAVAATASAPQGTTIRGPNEEEDAFHVRSTYARLDRIGVPGDGYEEGVERTRERAVLNHRMSVARFPPGMHRGESGEVEGLDPKESALRETLDRYGFFTSPLSTRSESRIFPILSASLATLPFLAGPSKGSAPSPSSPPMPPPLTSDPPPPRGDDGPSGKEAARISKWERMLIKKRFDKGGNTIAWEFDAVKRKKLERRVYKGIPDRWRAAAWGTLIDEMIPPSSSGRVAGKGKARDSDEDLIREYQSRIEQPSSFDVQIDLDVPRTISGHVLFHTRYGLGQRGLFHTLHAFSLHCPECGYCQGMGSIAANLLCYYSAERTYAYLVRLHDKYDLHAVFEPGFPGMLEAFYVQERLVELVLPDVYKVLKREMVSTSSYATKWFITLFTTTLPFRTQLRVWDAWFLEGRDLIVIVSLAILWSFRDNLTSSEASFETVLSLLSSFFVPEDDDALMEWVRGTLAIKGIRERMDGWREEWRAMGPVEGGKRLL